MNRIDILKSTAHLCWPYIIITVLTVLCYYPNFSGEFIMDDIFLVKENAFIREAPSLFTYLSQEDGITDASDAGKFHTGYYRPLINLTYWIDYKVWGMNASGFRSTNLLMHILACFILFNLLGFFFKDKKAVLLAAMMFSLHPVNTEAVSLVTSRNNILVTIFVLLSLYQYILAFKKENNSRILVSALLFLLALLSKESGIMLLPILFVYHRVFLDKEKKFFKEIVSYVPFILIIAFYMAVRLIAIDAVLHGGFIEGMGRRIYFAPYLILLNLRSILFPYLLHSFYVIYPSSFSHFQSLVSIPIICLGLFIIWKRREHKWITFSTLAFILSIIPTLNIIPIVSVSIVNMRWLYFPLCFASMVLAWAIPIVVTRAKFMVLLILGSVTVYFGSYTFILNETLWKNENTFFKQEVLKFKNPLYFDGLGELYLREKNFEAAERYLEESFRYFPKKIQTHINYAALLTETGRVDAAILELTKANRYSMTYRQRAQWFNNMGMAQLKLRKDKDALKNFRKAVVYWPEQHQFWANLGGVYGIMGDYKNAISAIKKGLKISPESITLKINLITTYIRMKKYKEAITVIETIPQSERQMNLSIQQLLKSAKEGLHTSLR